MNYVLVDKKQLDEKGVFPFAELLPDGRVILPLNALKTITGLTGIDIVDSEAVKALQAEATLDEKDKSDNQTNGEEVVNE